MSVQPGPHDDLGVPADATMDEIHRAFRRLLRQHHPDTRRQGAGHDDESDRVLQRALTAYAALRERHAGGSASVRAGRGPQDPRPARATPSPASGPSEPLRATPVEWLPAAPTRPGP